MTNVVYGTISIDVAIPIETSNQDLALQIANTLLNNINVKTLDLKAELQDGSVHNFEVLHSEYDLKKVEED